MLNIACQKKNGIKSLSVMKDILYRYVQMINVVYGNSSVQ